MADVDGHKHHWEYHPDGKGRVPPGLDQSSPVQAIDPLTSGCLSGLVDGSLRKVVSLWLKRESAESLFVLGNVLPKDIQESLGLLGAKVNGLVVANGDLIGAFAGGVAKNKLKIPDAHAHLHTVGVGLAVVGRLGQVQVGLLRGWTHDSIR